MSLEQSISKETQKRLSVVEDLDGFSGAIPGLPVRRWLTPELFLLGFKAIILCAVLVPTLLTEGSGAIAEHLFVMGLVVVFMSKQAFDRGSWGISKYLKDVFFSEKVKHTKAIPFSVNTHRVTLGSRVIALEQIVFVRLTAPRESAPYVWLQIFVRSGEELRWKVGNTYRRDVHWLAEYLRVASKALTTGKTPKALDRLRSVDVEEMR